MSTETYNFNRQSVCATCLSQDRKLIAMTDSQASTLSSLELSLNLSDMICWECRGFVRRMVTFKSRAQKAQECLWDLSITLQQQLPNLSPLSTSTGVSVDILPESSDIKPEPPELIEVMIKQEFDEDELRPKDIQSLPTASTSTSYKQEVTQQPSRGVPMSARVTVTADSVPTLMKQADGNDDIDIDERNDEADVEMSVLPHVVAPEPANKNLLLKNTDETETNCAPENSEESTEKLPKNSRQAYNKCYENFMVWKLQNKMASFSENVFLEYFQNIQRKFKPSTLWTEFSKLKATIYTYHQVDMSKYTRLLAFLNGLSEGFQAKKAPTFTSEELNRFIEEAPEQIYLLAKVAVIFGIMGACSRLELYRFKQNNVIDTHNTLIVHVMNNKKRIDRTFTITDKFYDICKKYMDLRPKPCENPSFFLRYFNGKCYVQSIGINTFGQIGKTVAAYLKLEHPELYTSHCFRRTSAKLLDVGDAIIGLHEKSTVTDDSINSGIKSDVVMTIDAQSEDNPRSNEATNINTTPANATSTTPANATSTTPANATSTTPGNATSTTPANATSTTPGNATSTTPANATSTTPANATSSSPAYASQITEKNAAIHVNKPSRPIIISRNAIQHLHLHFHK